MSVFFKKNAIKIDNYYITSYICMVITRNNSYFSHREQLRPFSSPTSFSLTSA